MGKDSISLGGTALTAAQVQALAAQLGDTNFKKTSYNRIKHNCVDFASHLGQLIEADELPSWCHRGATVGRLVGSGVDSMSAAAAAGIDKVTAAAARAATLNKNYCGQQDVADP